MAGLLSLTALVQAQVTFTGLSPNYCVNSPNAVLSTTATGGSFSGIGVIGSVFSPSIAGPGTFTVTYGTCPGSYAITTGTGTTGGYSPTPIPTGTTESGVNLTDDAMSGACNIGFSFDFYCNTYTQFYISSNGFITFANNGNNGCCNGQFLPNGAAPFNLIAPCWTDLNPGVGGSISYITLGTAPTRTCIIKYFQVPNFGSGGSPLTTQIKLMETTNIIEFHTTSYGSDNSHVHTMGIENAAGSVAHVVSGRNAATGWNVTNELVRFTPVLNPLATQTTVVSPATISVVGNNSICAGSNATLSALGNTTYTWSTGSNNANITVSPASTTSYSVSGTNSVGCVANSVITVTVFNGTPVVSATTSTNSACLGQTVMLTANGAPNYTWTNGVTNGVPFTPTGTVTYVVTGGNACGTATAAVTVTVAPLPVSIIAQPSLVCAGSASSLTAVSTATTYTWVPVNLNTPGITVNPTVSTIYTVLVSDGVCSGSKTISVLANPIPTINSTISSSVVCSGQSVTLTASGGLSYLWTPGNLTGSVVVATVTGPTLFQVIGYNSFSCSAASNQVVITNPSPTISIAASDNLICGGAAVTLTASGATTYTWNNGSNTSTITDTPGSTTIYTISGTTSNCSSTQTIQIGVFTPSVAVTGQTAICSGATATLIASGADNYTWNNGSPAPIQNVTPASTTIYTVSATTASGNIVCPSSATFQVLVNPNPTVSVVPTRTFMCIKESNTLTASGVGTSGTYSWSTGATGPTVALTSSVATTLNFTVTGTDANGCRNAKVIQVKVNGCTAIAELDPSKGFVIYPNPNNGSFHIELNEASTLLLSNELGQLVKAIEFNEQNQFKVNVQNLSPGIYFISGSGIKAKIIVE